MLEPNPKDFGPFFSHLPALTVCPGLSAEQSGPGGQNVSTESPGQTRAPPLFSPHKTVAGTSVSIPLHNHNKPHPGSILLPCSQSSTTPTDVENHKSCKDHISILFHLCIQTRPVSASLYSQKQPHATSARTPRRKIRATISKEQIKPIYFW